MLQKIKELSRFRGNDRSSPWPVARRRIAWDVPDSSVLEVLDLVHKGINDSSRFHRDSSLHSAIRHKSVSRTSRAHRMGFYKGRVWA